MGQRNTTQKYREEVLQHKSPKDRLQGTCGLEQKRWEGKPNADCRVHFRRRNTALFPQKWLKCWCHHRIWQVSPQNRPFCTFQSSDCLCLVLGWEYTTSLLTLVAPNKNCVFSKSKVLLPRFLQLSRNVPIHAQEEELTIVIWLILSADSTQYPAEVWYPAGVGDWETSTPHNR